MSHEEELLFPEELLVKRLISTGDMCGWRIEDVSLVVKACQEIGLAIMDITTEFFLPDGTCELYWLRADSNLRKKDEIWAKYVDRSCSEVLQSFTDLVNTKDFEKEGIESFHFLKMKKDEGVNILNYLCFEIGAISETRYNELFK
jgi:hypothetical protein